jgi:hypothetical protein
MCENDKGLSGLKVITQNITEPICKMCKTRKTGGDNPCFSFMLNGEKQNMTKPAEYCRTCMTRDFIGFMSSPRSTRITFQLGKYYRKSVHVETIMPRQASITPSTCGLWGGSRGPTNNRRTSYYIQKKHSLRSEMDPKAY